MAHGDERPRWRDASSSAAGPAFGRRRPSPRWITLETGEQLELAEPSARLRAKVIDLMILVAVIIVGIVLVVLSAVAAEWGVGVGIVEGVLLSSVMFGLVSLLYDPVLIAVRGQTVGKMAMRIRVVRADNGELPSWGRSFGRWAVPGALIFIPGVGFLPALACYASLIWDASNRGWHDKAAGTVVVKA